MRLITNYLKHIQMSEFKIQRREHLIKKRKAYQALKFYWSQMKRIKSDQILKRFVRHDKSTFDENGDILQSSQESNEELNFFQVKAS